MIIHTATKSILLQAPDPFMLRDLIPKSRLVDHPDANIAIQHTTASTKILRNVGFDIPAPIHSQYDWPGRYTPFDHQRVMAEFLTLNKKCFNLSEMGCVDAATEYLSPTGWVRMDQYTGGKVAQYIPDTGAIEFVDPTEYVKLPCPEMIKIKTKYGVDQLLSPEHRVLLQAYADPTKLEVLSAEQLLARHEAWLAKAKHKRQSGVISWGQATIPATFTVPGGPGHGLALDDDQLRVQVAAIADGHFPGSTSWCVVRLKKERKKSRMRLLLNNARIDWKETSNDTATSQGYTTFRFYAPIRLKTFDARFWQSTAAQLSVIAEEVMHWDGCVRGGARASSFSSYDKQSADFVQYAAVSSGVAARLSECRHTDRGRDDTEYVVTVRPTISALMLKSMGSKGDRRRVMWREPSTDGFKYCFMVPSTFLVFRRNGCVFASGNTAKTNAALWAADYLMRVGRVRKVLILSPLSTLERVWLTDIFDTLMHRRAVIVHGTLERRKQALAADVDFYILNHDGVAIGEINEIIRKRPDIDLVVIDEVSMFRNHQTKKYKMLVKMLRPDMRLWLLTGTPCPNAPTDAWALARLVSPGKVPQYFGAFKRQTMTQISQFKWVPRADAYNQAFQAMQPAVRFRKADCLDLPPVMYEDRQCVLSKEQRAAFETMRTQMQAEARETKITAVNAADKINKIRQILCGVVKDPSTDNYLSLPHAPRLNVLLECIEQASAKVLVIVPFKGIIWELAKEIEPVYSCAVLNGDVSPKQRDRIIREFKSQTDPHVLLCHPKVMAHGLNLTEADTLIFYAPIYSNDEAQQVTERFNRAGQTRKMTVVKLAAHPIEWEIYKSLDNKRVTQDNILNLYKSVID